MVHSLRTSCAIALALFFLSAVASADLKITTRTTVMGHSTESTVYIKGARERREMSFGGREAATTITQCDQKRAVTLMGGRCMVMPMGGNGEATSCPAVPSMGGAMGMGESEAPPRAGGVVTITRTVTDTGERQEMFGYKARHLKTLMMTESSPDACNQSHMRMETDGWYADVSAAFSCSNEPARMMACGGGMGRPGAPRCSDRIVMKGGGGAPQGYPLKQTMTMISDHGTFSTTTEVVDITNATLDPALFEAPANCRVMDMAALPSSAAPPQPPSQPTPQPAAAAPAPAPKEEAPAPAVAPKEAGMVRIGVVKLKDASGQDLPTDNLMIDLLSEITHRQMDAIQLESETPYQAVLTEARAKQCDYILYTTLSQMVESGHGGLPPATVPKDVKLDPAKFQALTGMTLYKVVKPLPEIKDLYLAADDPQLGVNAVMNTFEKESDKIAQQVELDAHPKAALKTPAKHPATHKPL